MRGGNEVTNMVGSRAVVLHTRKNQTEKAKSKKTNMSEPHATYVSFSFHFPLELLILPAGLLCSVALHLAKMLLSQPRNLLDLGQFRIADLGHLEN